MLACGLAEVLDAAQHEGAVEPAGLNDIDDRVYAAGYDPHIGHADGRGVEGDVRPPAPPPPPSSSLLLPPPPPPSSSSSSPPPPPSSSSPSSGEFAARTNSANRSG